MSESPEQIQQEIDRSRERAAEKIDQIGAQFQDATTQARETVKQDMPEMLHEGLDVAKAEFKEDLAKVGVGSAEIAGGALLGGIGGVFLLQSVMELLAQRLPRWQAAGLMGLGLTGAALALGMGGKQQLEPDQLKPTRTMSVLQQTVGWTKARTQSLRSRVARSDSEATVPEVTEPEV